MTETLAGKTCTPCRGGVPPLTREEAKRFQEQVRLVDLHDQVAWHLNWNTERLPSCLLWMSNRGRTFPPWNGRNLCVGVEPVASAFDLGSVIASTDNPIARAGVATTITVEPDIALALGYRLRGQSVLG